MNQAESDANTRGRIPNKTKDALEDIAAHCMAIKPHWQQIMDRAERNTDPALAIPAARLLYHVSEIERLAKDARNGSYAGRD